MEEATELAEALPSDPAHVAAEFADVLYFAMVAAARAGVHVSDVERVLDKRALKVVRRKGDAKKGKEPCAQPPKEKAKHGCQGCKTKPKGKFMVVLKGEGAVVK